MQNGNEVDFVDGSGPRSKDTPAEFPSDWHFQAHLDDLERDVAGLLHRVEELRGMPAAHPDQIKAAEAAVEVAKEKLAAAAGPAKRPRRAREKR